MSKNISYYGFGGYRIHSQSKEHRQALIHALQSGCSLIDTSSNYSDGESEVLIGQVLQEHTEFKPFLITKAGYIQGKNLEVIKKLNESGLAVEDLVNVDEGLKHSIHPEFLENQIKLSLERLAGTPIDCFLLHNPEYYFESGQEGIGQEEYLQRIKKAMVYLETAVDLGLIKSWGISSNNFGLSPADPKVTNFLKIWEIYEKIGGKNFKLIQFPYNMVEQGANEKKLNGKSLIECAKEKSILTVANRPLNAFDDNQLIRLAYYELDEKLVDPHFQKNCWDQMYQGLLEKWLERGGSEQELKDLPLLCQVKEVWNELPSKDAVNQVFLEHFFPMLTQIWGKSLTEQEAGPYYGLYDLALASALHTSNKQTRNWENKAGLKRDPDIKLQKFVCQQYKSQGIDHVLVGMRHKDYVDDFLN